MPRQGPYTPEELAAVFTMADIILSLSKILDSPKPNKRAMLRALMAGPCPTRSRGSLEAKLMNVSGASVRVNGPIIPGYQPAPNCQRVMVDIARTLFIDGDTSVLCDKARQALVESQTEAVQMAIGGAS